MKCFQIEIKYINENEQPVGVTIISDPLPITSDINKDNENDVISEVLNYIYDNPNASGHSELMSVLENATATNQINVYDVPLNYKIEKIEGISKKELEPVKVDHLLKFLHPTYADMFRNCIQYKEQGTAFPLKVLVFPKDKVYIKGENKLELVANIPSNQTEDSLYSNIFYDSVTNTIFLRDGINDSSKAITRELVRFLIDGNQLGTLDEILNGTVELIPTSSVPYEYNREFLNIVNSLRPALSDDTKELQLLPIANDVEVDRKAIDRFGALHNTKIFYVGPIKGESVKTFNNPFTYKDRSGDLIYDHIAYNMWLRGLPLPLNNTSWGVNTGNKTGFVTDMFKEQKDWITSEIDALDKMPVVYVDSVVDQYNSVKGSEFLRQLLESKLTKQGISNSKRKMTNDIKAIKKAFAPGSDTLYKISNIDADALRSFISKYGTTDSILNISDLMARVALGLARVAETMTPDEFFRHVEPSLMDSTAKAKPVDVSGIVPGTTVEYAGNTYLLWSINPSGKAKLMKPDGTKYSGTPELNKLTPVSKAKPFKYNGKDYVGYAGMVISLATGSKIKDRNILSLSALNDSDTLLSVEKRSKPVKVTQGSILYGADQESLYNEHVRLFKEAKADAEGVVVSDSTKHNNIEAMQELEALYYDAVAKLGKTAVGNLKYFTTNFGKNGATFRMAVPTKSDFTIDELRLKNLKELEFRQRLTKSSSKPWEALNDSEKEFTDSERFKKERMNDIFGKPTWKNADGTDNSFAEYSKFGNEITATSLLEVMGDEKGRGLAKALNAQFGTMLDGVTVQFVNEVDLNNTVNYEVDEDSEILGSYNTKSKVIKIANPKTTDLNKLDNTIIHEVLHAITYDHLRKDTQANREFTEIYKLAQELLPESYALSSIDEFLVAIYTNPKFKKELQTVKTDDKTLFGKVFDFFSKIFNFGKDFETEMLNIFEKVFDVRHSKDSKLHEKAKRTANNVLSEIADDAKDYAPKSKNEFKHNPNKSFRTTDDLENGMNLHSINDKTVNNEEVINGIPEHRQSMNSLTKYLSNLYDLPVEVLNSNEIDAEFSKNGINYGRHRAFVENGMIVINSDYATMGEPIHELSHLILDGLKMTNISEYNELMNAVKTHPTYDYVRRAYPELSGNDILEETFTTIVGEHYSEYPEPFTSKMWNENNNGFFNKLVNTIKNFFAEVFGIDSYRFFDMPGSQLMNTDLHTLLTGFTTKVLNGDYVREVELATRKDLFVKEGTFLKNADLDESSLNEVLKHSGMTNEMAAKIWVKSKTNNFKNWHKGDLVAEYDGEPRVFYTTDDPNIVSMDPSEDSRMVVLRGNSMLQEVEPFKYKIASINIKSIHNLDNGEKDTFRYTGGVDNYANLNGIKMIGTPVELRYSISKLKEVFPNTTFVIQTFGNVDYIEHYKSPAQDVAELRNTLLKKSIKKVC